MAFPAAAVQAGLGLAGSLIRGKTPSNVKNAERLLGLAERRQNQVWDQANNYDPMREVEASANLAAEKGARAIGLAKRGLDAKWATNGGGAQFSNNYLTSMQRDVVDDPLSSIHEQVYMDRARAPLQKLAVLGQYAGAPGQLANQWLGVPDSNNRNIGASLSMFAQGLDGLIPGQDGTAAHAGGLATHSASGREVNAPKGVGVGQYAPPTSLGLSGRVPSLYAGAKPRNFLPSRMTLGY